MRSDRETAYTAFVAARQHHLRRVAYALCGDWHKADDLIEITVEPNLLDGRIEIVATVTQGVVHRR